MTIDEIDESIYGKESEMKKAQRKIKQEIKDDDIVKKLSEENQIKDILKTIYEDFIKILKYYLDMREDYYPLTAIWIIGTYLHEEFETYPYLFLNAMRGSAKTRLLKLIACLSKKGEVLASLKEAVLFRTARDRTICIDEFERIGSKEKADLRELLNAAYKKGIIVKRMKKKRVPDPETGRLNEEQVVEEFDMYCPIALANIWGMEEVLGDRCIFLILERSAKKSIIKILEDFKNDKNINDTKKYLNLHLNSVVMSLKPLEGGVYKDWNNYIKYLYDTTTHTTFTVNNDTSTLIIPLFEKIDKANIDGRHLELFFPLFIIANNISEQVLNETIKIAKKLIQEKSEEEFVESRDVTFIDFISQQEETDFISVLELTKKFKEYLKEEQEETKFINTRWVGRALKRLNLYKEKRRLARGREVILNIEKAKEKIQIFKLPKKEQVQQNIEFIEKPTIEAEKIPEQLQDKRLEDEEKKYSEDNPLTE